MDQPVRLPRAREARISTDKLLRYALDLTDECGQHKARVFASALGITTSDGRYLHDQILEALPDAEVRATRITPFGVGYEAGRDDRRRESSYAPRRHNLDPRSRPTSATDLDLGRYPVGCENHQTMADKRHTILGVVELLVASARWPTGAIGTVVDADDELALVGISDDRGHALDFVSLPRHALATRPGRPSQRVAS
jgi:hypothetical protein